MEKKKIYEKLLSIQSQKIGVEKDGNNPHFKSKYMTLDSIVSTYSPILTKEKLVAYHETKDDILTTYITSAEDESFISSQFKILNTDPQKRGSEITYGKRYNLGQLLNIITDEDDDGNKASGDNFVNPHTNKKAPFTLVEFKELTKCFMDGGLDVAGLWVKEAKEKLLFPDFVNKKVSALGEYYKTNNGVTIEDAERIWKTFDK